MSFFLWFPNNRDMFSLGFQFASLIWGSIGSGYCIYGKKRGETVPFVGGMVLVGLSFFVVSAFLMSILSIALIAAMYWLMRLGY
jgi:hypothetical protein